jgi:U3 small nucleolar RNA-associated protein 11
LDDDAGDDLDETELEILREAGIISRSRTKGKSKKPKHIVFVDTKEEAHQYASRLKSPSNTADADVSMEPSASHRDLGWKVPECKKKRRKSNVTLEATTADDLELAAERKQLAAQNRSRLLKELSARLARDTQLRYAEREFEMQRALMGKGGSRKLRGVEKVEGDNGDGSEDNDEKDDRRAAKGRRNAKKVDEKTWKPRVYKWRLERKR